MRRHTSRQGPMLLMTNIEEKVPAGRTRDTRTGRS